jgi:hypothetical protein
MRSNHPFAALLVSAEGDTLIEMENGFMPDRDMTGAPSGCWRRNRAKPTIPTLDLPCRTVSAAGRSHWTVDRGETGCQAI